MKWQLNPCTLASIRLAGKGAKPRYPCQPTFKPVLSVATYVQTASVGVTQSCGHNFNIKSAFSLRNKCASS